MPKGVLENGETLRQFIAGPVADLCTKASGEEGHEWKRQFTRFLRKEPTWERDHDSIKSAIASCGFDWVHAHIEQRFAVGSVRTHRRLFNFSDVVPYERIRDSVHGEGWEFSNLSELLVFTREEWNGRDWVAALGSCCTYGDGYGASDSSPFLCTRGAERCLDLKDSVWGWHRCFSFLASRD
ncbi:hypothetical protein HY413_00385 [Candidatus Kaiserbacteria bacterium]|nr:hypothetical protein [Candidatus Kaiserbacteria bacterium]